MNKQPLLACVIGFSFGIITQEFFNFQEMEAIGGLVFGLILWSLGWIKNLFFDKIKSILLLIFFSALGIFSHFLNSKTENLPEFEKNKLHLIIFKLNQKLNTNEKNKRYEIEVLNFDKPFTSVVSIPKDQPELDFQHYYSANAYLNRTEKPQYDYQFDYQKYLARQNIHYQSYIPNEILISKKENLTFSEQIKNQRWKILHRIDQSLLQEKNKALLKGIILADRTEIDREVIHNFSRTGLIHILAISGSHMAIVFLLILFVLKPLFSVTYRNIPIFISIIGIWCFAILIDFGNSVVRSCIMISVYYIMIFLQRKPDLLHSMALAGLLILGWDTHQLFNIGFQLSFLAVFGIFWFYQPIIFYFRNIKNRVLRFFLNTFALSLSAQLMVMPLVVYYFHQFSMLSVFINVVSIFISQIFIVFSFIVCILFGINLLFDEILRIYDFSANFFLEMVAFFSRWDFSFQQNIPLALPEMLILLTIVFLFRKVLTQPSGKIFLKTGFLIFLFVLMRISLSFYWEQKEEVLEHKFFKQNIVSIKKGNQVTFITSDQIDLEKVKNFVIYPYFVSVRGKKLEIKSVTKGKVLKIKDSTYEIK